MAETVSPGNWQSVGSTINDEYKFVTHLKGPTALSRSRSTLHRKGSVRNVGGATGLDRTASQLSGAPSLKRQNAVRLTNKARILRFLRRFTWRKRAKNYIFGKQFLQRQPSLVITPDLSTLSFHFTNCDLIKRKPRPHCERKPMPVLVSNWKNQRNMQMIPTVPRRTRTRTSGFNPTISDPIPTGPNGNGPDGSGPDGSGYDPSSTSNGFNSESSKDPNSSSSGDDKGNRNWVRISLPLKPRNHFSSFNNGADFGLSDLENLEGDKDDTNGSEAKTGNAPSGARAEKTNSAVGQKHKSQVADFGYVDHKVDEDAQGETNTPAPNKARTSGTAEVSHTTPKVSQKNTAKITTDTPSAPNNSDTTPPSAESGKSKRSSWLTQIPQTPVQGFPQPSDGTDGDSKSKSSEPAYAVSTTPLESPTALPSSYRPESWRKSAIISRQSMNRQSYLDEATYIEGLTSSWSTYLRQAVAQRAMNSKQRRSREIQNEIRWSRNLAWDSEDDNRQSMFSDASLGRTDSSASGGYSDGYNERPYAEHRFSDHVSAAIIRARLATGIEHRMSAIEGRRPLPATPNTRPASVIGNVSHKYETGEYPSNYYSTSSGTPGSRNSGYASVSSDSNHDYSDSGEEDTNGFTVSDDKRWSTPRSGIPSKNPRETNHESVLEIATTSSSADLLGANHPSEYSGLAHSNWNRERDSRSTLSESLSQSTASYDDDTHHLPVSDIEDMDEHVSEHSLSHTDATNETIRAAEPSSVKPAGVVPSELKPPSRGPSSTNQEQPTQPAVSSSRVYKHSYRPSIDSDEFDFSQRESRKRPLPPSPVTSPNQSTVMLPTIDSPMQSTTNVGEVTLPKHTRSNTEVSEASSNYSSDHDNSESESAPTIIRSQSKWSRRSSSVYEHLGASISSDISSRPARRSVSGPVTSRHSVYVMPTHKRQKSTSMNPDQLLSRQATLHSKWGEEDDLESDGE